MHYPVIVYSSRTKFFPIFPDLVGEPHIADISSNSRLLHGPLDSVAATSSSPSRLVE